MESARYYAAATKHVSGKVLVTGGEPALLDSVEVYSDSSGAWKTVAPMLTGRSRHICETFTDASGAVKVLVAGGMDQTNTGLASVEIYDPAADTWTAGPSMEYPRIRAASVLLDDGRILVVGGRWGQTLLDSAEIYDPTANGWTTIAMTSARDWPGATLLANGEVLVSGGRDSTGVLDTVEIFSPSGNAFRTVSAVMAVPRWMHTATRLLDGRVLLCAGMKSSTAYWTQSEIFDPQDESIVPTDPLPDGRAEHTACLRPDGHVCVCGGYGLDTGMGSVRMDCWRYDPAAASGSKWKSMGMMKDPRTSHLCVMLDDSCVCIGGNAGSMGAMGSTSKPLARCEEMRHQSGNLAPVSLLAPADKEAAGPGTVSFDWTDNSDPMVVGYRLQISRSARMGEPLEVSQDNGVSMSQQTLVKGTYFWRVAARSASSRGYWSSVWSFTVSNSAPVLTVPGAQSGGEGSTIVFAVSATDADADPVVLTAADLPLGAVFDASGSFSWTPDYDQAGTYTVVFSASDGEGSDTGSVTITVQNVNRAPVLNAIGDRSVAENSNLSFTVTGSDPDGQTVIFSATDLPAGASFSGATFSWTPTYDQAGSYSVTFHASDGSLMDMETIAITVTDVNRPPALAALASPQSVPEAGTLSITLSATDPDNNSLTYSATPLTNASLSGNVWTFNPGYGQNGSYTIAFRATDSGGLYSERFVDVLVMNSLAAPTGLASTSALGQILLSWNANAESDLDHYRLHRATTSGGPYSQIGTAVGTSYTDVVAGGATYYYIVKAVDSAGNVSEASGETSGRALRQVRYEQTSASLFGTWQSRNDTSASGYSYVRSSSSSAVATFKFTGKQVKWIAHRAGNHGIARVYIDGVLQGSVDLYAATTQWKSTVYDSGSVSYGLHELRIEVTGTKNAASSGKYVPVDAFDVIQE